MSNHYHIVLKISPNEGRSWSDDAVLQRWTVLFKGPTLVQRHLDGDHLSAAELVTLADVTSVLRSRLCSLSWFMKCLNEPIARRANKEDDCTGHFWEARFHSQALLSEKALISAMAYVDLNPVRANIARTPESAEFTSLRSRLSSENDNNDKIVKLLQRNSNDEHSRNLEVRPLYPFVNQGRTPDSDTLPINLHQYLQLVDLSARKIINGKTGRLDPSLRPILERLELSTNQWLSVSCLFRQFCRKGEVHLSKAA